MGCEVYNKNCSPCNLYGKCGVINYGCVRVKALEIKKGENPNPQHYKLKLEKVLVE